MPRVFPDNIAGQRLQLAALTQQHSSVHPLALSTHMSPDDVAGHGLQLGHLPHHSGAQLHEGSGRSAGGVVDHQRPPACTQVLVLGSG